MPTDLSCTFTLTRQHFEVLERVMKALNVDESEANRIIYDHAVNSERSIGIPALDEERRVKKLELSMLDRRVSAMRNAFPCKHKESPQATASQGESSSTSSSGGMSPKEIIDNYQDDIEKDTPTGRIALAHVREAIAAQPDLVSRLSERQREFFRPGGDE